jgi:hypothetical protein
MTSPRQQARRFRTRSTSSSVQSCEGENQNKTPIGPFGGETIGSRPGATMIACCSKFHFFSAHLHNRLKTCPLKILLDLSKVHQPRQAGRERNAPLSFKSASQVNPRTAAYRALRVRWHLANLQSIRNCHVWMAAGGRPSVFGKSRHGEIHAAVFFCPSTTRRTRRRTTGRICCRHRMRRKQRWVKLLPSADSLRWEAALRWPISLRSSPRFATVAYGTPEKDDGWRELEVP